MKRKISLYFFFLTFILIISTPVSQIPLDSYESYPVAFSVGDKFEIQHQRLFDLTINNTQKWGLENETYPGIVEIITDPYFHPQVPEEEGEMFDYTLTRNGQTFYYIRHLMGWFYSLFYFTDMAYYSYYIVSDELRGRTTQPIPIDVSPLYWYGYFATNELSFYQSLIEDMDYFNTTKILDYFFFDDIKFNYNDHKGNFSYGIQDDIFKIYSNESYYFTDLSNQTEKYEFIVDTQVNITHSIVEKQILYFKYTLGNNSFTFSNSFFNNSPLKTSTSSTTSSTTYTSTSESPMINQIETNSPRFVTRNLSTPNYVIYISALLIISLLRISYRKKS